MRLPAGGDECKTKTSKSIAAELAIAAGVAGDGEVDDGNDSSIVTMVVACWHGSKSEQIRIYHGAQ